MTRERFISPQIWTSEQVCNVNRDARQLFIGIISTADDQGRRTASPHRLKADIFPFDGDVDKDQVQAWRDQLFSQGLIRVYLDGETEVLDIPKFAKWQRLRYRARSAIHEHPSDPLLEEPVEGGQNLSESDKTSALGCDVLCSGVKSTSTPYTVCHGTGTRPDYTAIKGWWNTLAGDLGLSPIREVTPERRAAIRRKFLTSSFQDLAELERCIRAQPFLFGEGNRGWRLSFDALFTRREMALKILEMTYKGKTARDDYTALRDS